MKKLLSITLLFLIFSCSDTNEVGNSPLETIVEPTSISKEDYIYTLGEVMIKWTAFKHLAKAQVGGTFKSSIVEGFTESVDLNNSVSGVTFKIPVNSTSTNDTVRDYKIVNSFFKTMVNTDFITGKIISLNNNGTGLLSISMNNSQVEKKFN